MISSLAVIEILSSKNYSSRKHILFCLKDRMDTNGPKCLTLQPSWESPTRKHKMERAKLSENLSLHTFTHRKIHIEKNKIIHDS